MKLPFDKIFVLTLVETPERLENFYNEIKKLNIENDISVWHACRHPHVYDISHYLKNNGKFYWNGEGNGAAFNCTREHYNMIKYAYYSGAESILIFEDDMQFKNNIDEVVKLLETPLPEGWNVIHYGHYPGYSNTYDKRDNIPYILENRISYEWGTPMYALSHEGMKYYIDFIDNVYSVADFPLFLAGENNNITGTYSCIPTLYCEHTVFKSEIQQ